MNFVYGYVLPAVFLLIVFFKEIYDKRYGKYGINPHGEHTVGFLLGDFPHGQSILTGVSLLLRNIRCFKSCCVLGRSRLISTWYDRNQSFAGLRQTIHRLRTIHSTRPSLGCF